jgi:uncharacterized protein
MAGEMYYFTLPARDLGKAKAFYAGLFGWEFEDGGHIKNVAAPYGGLGGGSADSHPVIFLHVDDMQAAVEKVRALGGEAEDVQESASGWWAGCQDDQGTHFSIGKIRPGFD